MLSPMHEQSMERTIRVEGNQNKKTMNVNGIITDIKGKQRKTRKGKQSQASARQREGQGTAKKPSERATKEGQGKPMNNKKA